MVNPSSNAILESIHQVLGDLVRTYTIKDAYIYEDDPWLVILAAAAFTILSTEIRLKGYCPGQLVFGRNMIHPIKHMVDWELIHQRK